MTKILPNPFIEKFNAEINKEILASKLSSQQISFQKIKISKEEIKKIVVSWFDKEVKRGHFDLDELIDSLYELISK